MDCALVVVPAENIRSYIASFTEEPYFERETCKIMVFRSKVIVACVYGRLFAFAPREGGSADWKLPRVSNPHSSQVDESFGTPQQSPARICWARRMGTTLASGVINLGKFARIVSVT